MMLAEPLWREFREYDNAAIEWLKAGNIAITPGMVERIGGGPSMYLHAGTPERLAAASRAIDATPPVGPNRTGVNIDGEFLLRAIVKCRRHRLGAEATATAVRLAVPDPEPWESRCPGCSSKFFAVVVHTVTVSGDLTMVACARGHRWNV